MLGRNCHRPRRNNAREFPRPPSLALSNGAAGQLANATKTTAQMATISPRWLVRFMDWVPVEAGIYRLNKVKQPKDVEIACPPRSEIDLPTTFVDYEGNF